MRHSDPEMFAFARKLGEGVGRVRRSRRLTQQALAAKLGRKSGTIANVESGRSCPSLYFTYQIAQVLGCNVAEFFIEYDQDETDKVAGRFLKLVERKGLTMNDVDKICEIAKIVFADKHLATPKVKVEEQENDRFFVRT